MINGWQFALFLIAYFVFLTCALCLAAAAKLGDNHPVPPAELRIDELALRRSTSVRVLSRR